MHSRWVKPSSHPLLVALCTLSLGNNAANGCDTNTQLYPKPVSPEKKRFPAKSR